MSASAAASRESRPLVLEATGMTKRFGAAPVLRGVSLTIRPGEVHALAGENGAGKSTLVKIISGALRPDAGIVRVGGVSRTFVDPAEARRAGVVAIHQELSLVGALSIADNLALGAASATPWIRRADERRAAAAKLAVVGLAVDPDALVESLPIGAQQLVEIARGVAEDAALFVFDEPTSALGDADAARLFERIDRLAAQGKGVLFVSHRAADLDRIARTLTVLRDGRVALSAPYATLTHAAIARAMLGEAAIAAEARTHRDAEATDVAASSEPALELDGVSVRDIDGRERVNGVSLRVFPGEIVGLAGLRGAGPSELLEGLYGAAHARTGDVRIAGAALEPGAAPRASMARGLGYVAADRQRHAVIGDMSALENATVAALSELAPRGVLDVRREARAIAPLLAPLGLAGVDLRAPMGSLSGGTQQKICLARALLTRPRVLLVDEPTRGVDVGAKAAIHAFLRGAAEGGLAIVFASTDAEELASLATRVVVFARGAAVAEVDPRAVTRAELMRAAMGAGATEPA